MDGSEVFQQIAGDWATSLDIKSAFNHMRVSEEFRPFLCFEHRGKYYVYNSMPFGCRHSSRVFMRVLSYTMAYILLHQDKAYLELANLQIAIYLRSLGWTLSMEKCEFTPAQVITFIGWRWDFGRLTLSMTSAMRSTLLFTLNQWDCRALRGERVNSRAFGSIIGCLNFLPCQIPRASLYLRTLRTALASAVRSTGWNGCTTLSRAIVSELLWWRQNVWYNTPFDFRARDPQAILTTDACKTGCGAELVFFDQSFISYGSF
jgi:hypothetical protein